VPKAPAVPHLPFALDEAARPSLVQRLLAPWTVRPDAGFDGRFRFDYMGSSEFEGNAAFQALRAIRALGDVVVTATTVELDARPHTIYLVGPSSLLPRFEGGLQAWVDSGARALEPTFLPERLRAEDDHHDDVLAWWDLKNLVTFTLDPDVAEQLRDALTTTPKATS